MNILVVDDHALFRDGVVSLLEAAGFTHAVMSAVEQATARAAELES